MLLVFGDSFSAFRTYLNDDNELDGSLHWTSIVCEEMNTNGIINYARPGATNQYILNSLIEQLPNIKNDDIVIINTSGQGRMPIGPNYTKSFFNDSSNLLCLLTNTNRTMNDFEKSQINWYYNNIFLPDIVEYDLTINNIINIANYISSREIVVILWNLTSLGFDSLLDSKLNDNVTTSPIIPFSNLWTPSSNGGKKGWVDIINEKKLQMSSVDCHPNIEGNRYIANEFINSIKTKHAVSKIRNII